mmetsp:Transcript_13308/g.25004  ORF Transcript_13308/g.25004 Transcript_13308/m.25004 type:complete len:335 (+) Transcript_13308:3-1007(+)
MKIDRWDAAFTVMVFLYLVLAPYTKVEESFNMQAAHDLLEHRTDVEKFDHVQFPGVVKRSFIGAIALSLFSYPAYYASLYLGFTKFCGTYIIRGALGLLNIGAFAFLRRTLDRIFGSETAVALYVVTVCQFHVPFYMTRTLPNSFAMFFCTLMFAFWLKRDYPKATSCIAFAGVVFRCDLILLAIPMGVWMISKSSRKDFLASVSYGVGAALLGVSLSIVIDSYYWQTFTWPELEVLLFNTVENRSSEWGTFPWHWYFTSALPRMLLTQALFVGAGLLLQKTRKSLIDERLLPILSLVLCFVLLYSFLPHKELRFLLPIAPGLNVIAAVGLAKL